MSAPYRRTREQMAGDFHRAKDFEAQVAAALPPWHINETNSTTRLDYWVPGCYLDAKEKRQKLTKRWWLLDGVDEVDLFVLDELGVRKALEHYPAAYFILRDVPAGGRLFLASCVELACVERARRNRVGKGKLVFDSRNFRPLESLDDLYPTIMADLAAVQWRQSACVGALEPKQI